MDIKINNLCDMITSLKSISITENDESLVVMYEGRVVTEQMMHNIIPPEMQQIKLEQAQIDLRCRLSGLGVAVQTTEQLYVGNLNQNLQDMITAIYYEKGYTLENIKKAIEDGCDPLYGTDMNIFNQTIMQSNNTAQQIINEPSIYADSNKKKILETYLHTILNDKNHANNLCAVIYQLFRENTPETIFAILNLLETDFLTDDNEFKKNIIDILYGEGEFAKIMHIKAEKEQKDKELSKQANARINEEAKKKYQDLQEISYTNALKQYRKNGLELDNKSILAIGSQLIDKTGANFNKDCTVFADLQYADLNGDIHETINILHENKQLHNKFKIINFTGIETTVLSNLQDDITLMNKLYDLLELDGIIIIYSGSIYHQEAGRMISNDLFVKEVLTNTNFQLQNVASINRPLNPLKNIYGDYQKANLTFMKNQNNPTSIEPKLTLVIKK